MENSKHGGENGTTSKGEKMGDIAFIEIHISEPTLRHIFNRHRDLAKILGANSVNELHRMLKGIIESPDEVFIDAFNVVKTAYILSAKGYRRVREKRWVQRLY